MKRNELLAVALVFAALFGAWVVAVDRWHRSVRPAGQTLADHLARRPAPEGRRVFVSDGKEFLALFGMNQGFPRFPSGPAVYVFDAAGRLADWTPDVGDDPAFVGRWPDSSSGREATPAEVAAWPGGE